MSQLTAKTTVYLNPQVKKFIQHKAVAEGRSVSEIINDYFADILEDLEDLKEIEKRRGEPTVSFEAILKDLGLTYEQLRGRVYQKRSKRTPQIAQAGRRADPGSYR